jgi:hypothetical protein
LLISLSPFSLSHFDNHLIDGTDAENDSTINKKLPSQKKENCHSWSEAKDLFPPLPLLVLTFSAQCDRVPHSWRSLTAT